jgi:phytoene dehydrogenase-like protein
MKSKVTPADFIIIGSGLGGLTIAAYLSRANYRVLVLEKNREIGGRCTTRIINGNRYVIGANTFGSRTAFILKNLGINIEWIPASMKLFGKYGYLTFPLSFSTINELKLFGCNFISILRSCSRFARTALHQPATIRSYRDLVKYLIKEPDARELLYSEAWYIGSHPDWLPSSALKLFLGTYYGYNKPVYPLYGAQAIPNALAEYIKARGGEILTEQHVKRINIEKGKAESVNAGNEWFSAKYGVISNAEIQQTLKMLHPKNAISIKENIYRSPKSAFPLSLLLLTLDAAKAPATISKPTALLETNATILTRPVCEIIEELESGQLNNSPICNLILTDIKAQLICGSKLPELPVNISVLWTRKPSKNININAITQSILLEIDKRYPGFANSVLSSKWITPADYEKKFGFSSNPAPVIETPIFKKHSWRLPIKGLYNVGTTIQPTGSHAGAAIESGISCAKEILEFAKYTNKL